jgi:putative ABC transport system permease protein
VVAWRVFGVAPVLPWEAVAATVVSVVALAVTTGLLANRGVLGRPPLEVLRAEG